MTSPKSTPSLTMSPDQLIPLTERINAVLYECSDKDWNYSRIRLVVTETNRISGPYALWYDIINTQVKNGKNELRNVEQEVSWGNRHASELGILELISLRINKVLLETSTNEFWENLRPVVRLLQKQQLVDQGISTAVWYDVTEVKGDDFENR